MAKTNRTREDVDSLRREAQTYSSSDVDLFTRMMRKARRWEREIEKREAEEANRPFDSMGFIIAYESGECTEEEVVEGFQHLINNGLAWTLQGSYGRTAMSLINAGYCTRP